MFKTQYHKNLPKKLRSCQVIRENRETFSLQIKAIYGMYRPPSETRHSTNQVYLHDHPCTSAHYPLPLMKQKWVAIYSTNIYHYHTLYELFEVVTKNNLWL